MMLQDSLAAIGACPEAVVWAKDYSTLRAAWKVCERGDWMLWLCEKMEGKKGWPTRQQVVLVACDCAELSLPIFEKEYPNDKRPRLAIEAARAWANGDGTIEQVRSAADAAYAAADAVNAAHAAYAAYAAAHSATYVAWLRECADLCRKGLKIPASIGGKP